MIPNPKERFPPHLQFYVRRRGQCPVCLEWIDGMKHFDGTFGLMQVCGIINGRPVPFMTHIDCLNERGLDVQAAADFAAKSAAQPWRVVP